MAEHYLNSLTVTLRVYSGHPMPANLREAISLGVNVGASVDLDEFAAALRQEIEPPRAITQTYRETTWGASGSGAQIVVEVLSTTAAVMTIWDKVRYLAEKHGRARPHADGPEEAARTAMAQNLNVAGSEIRISGLDAADGGHRVRLDTPHGRFTVDIADTGVTRVRRTGQ